jgi:hypothetical protein
MSLELTGKHVTQKNEKSRGSWMTDRWRALSVRRPHTSGKVVEEEAEEC